MIKPVTFLQDEAEDGSSILESGNEDSDSENENGKLKFNEEEELIEGDEDEVVTDSDYDKMSAKGEEEAVKRLHDAYGHLDMNNDGPIDLDVDEYTELDIEKLNELLFCVQGLGKFTDEKKTIYEKAQFCEPSMRDIHRFLRKDDPENPKCRISLLTWKIAENDIIPLLLNYENNERVQQLGLVILVDLTETLPDIVENRNGLEVTLTDLQDCISNSGLVDLLARSLADSTSKLRDANKMKTSLKLIEQEKREKRENKDKQTELIVDNENIEKNEINVVDDNEEEEKEKSAEIKKKIAEVEAKSQSLIELIFVLLKQILNITNSNNIKRNVNSTIDILNKFAQLKIFDAIIFHSQNFKTDYYKKLSVTLLELIFYLIRPFTVTGIFEMSLNCNNTSESSGSFSQMSLIQRLKEEEKQQKIQRQALLSSRPNNFGTTIRVNRPVDNSSFIVTNVNQLYMNKDKLISEKINQFTAQRRKPRRNQKPKSKNVLPSKAGEEIKLVNDLKVLDDFCTSIDYTYKDLIISFKLFCEDFLSNCLSEWIKYFYTEIKVNDRLEKYDVYHIINIMTFFLDFNRYKEHSLANEYKLTIKSKASPYEFNASMIKECILPEMMEFVYNLAYNESIRNSKKDLKQFELYASVRYMKQVLLTSLDLYKYKSDINLNYNVIIQDNLITKDFSKIIKATFILYNENYYPKRLLYECIELTEIYYSCLDLYSTKRKLKKKVINKKKKKKGKKEDDEEEELAKNIEEMDNFIEKNKNDNDDDKNEHTGSVNLTEDSANENENEYLERDLNVKEEAKTLLDYTIISRIVTLGLNNIADSVSSNTQTALLELKRNNPSLIRIIAKLFDRITHVLKEPWIFFQVEYMYIFQSLLSDSMFTGDIIFQSLINSIKSILKNFFEETRKNKLLAVESLFRFPTERMKDDILNNYEEPKAKENEVSGDDYYKPRESYEGDYDNDNNNNDEEGDNREVEYDGTNINLVRIEEEKAPKKNKLRKQNVIEEEEEKEEEVKWTENEDLMLVKNYLEFKDHEEVYDVLESLFTMKSKKEIKKRVKTLKLKKGEEKALKKVRKLHKKRKQKEEKMFNIIMDLSDLCSAPDTKRKIEVTINSIKEQLESYKVRKGLLGDMSELKCNLIPTSEEEIEIFENEKFKSFIRNIGLISPDDENDYGREYGNEKKNTNNKNFWKVDDKTDMMDIAIMVEKLTSFEMIINENVDVEIPEREEEREKAIKEKRLNNKEKKHKKDKKEKKHKKDKKEKKEKKEKKHRKRSFENSNMDVDSEPEENNNYKKIDIDSEEEDHRLYDNRSRVTKPKESIYTSKSHVKDLSQDGSNNNKNSYKSASVKYDAVSISNSMVELEDSSKKKKKRLKKGLREEEDYNFD